MPKTALLAGYVVVAPGARGRTTTNSAGEYYGTAPAAFLDLKAAVRYLRANKGRIPGDTSRIVSAGVSAGGALSSLLGAYEWNRGSNVAHATGKVVDQTVSKELQSQFAE